MKSVGSLKIFSFLTITLLVTIINSCKHNRESRTFSCKSVSIDTSYFSQLNDILQRKYFADGSLEVERYYPEGILKDIFTFYSNGEIQQYVYYHDLLHEPRYVLTYDSTCDKLPTVDGKIAYFKSECFGKVVTLNQLYSVTLMCATPPKMITHCNIYKSSDQKKWVYYGRRMFYADNDGVVIRDTVDFQSKYFMATLALWTRDSLYMLGEDTIAFQLNIETPGKSR